MDTFLFRVHEAAKYMGVCRSTAYDLVKKGIWPHVKVGRTIKIPRAALEAWVNDQLRQTEQRQADNPTKSCGE
jgi:excisionase family DNA binding protein